MQILQLVMIIGCFSPQFYKAEDGDSVMQSSSTASGSSLSTGVSESQPITNSANCSSQVHIFMNPGSGGKKGAALFKAGINGMKLLIDNAQVDIHVWDIRVGESGHKPGFQAVAAHLNSTMCSVRVIAAGGDGTVIWTMSEGVAHKLDLNRVLFGTIPYGTGNDFSHSFGWGHAPPRKLLANNLRELRDLATHWLQAETKSHDLWEVTILLDPNGGRIMQQSGKRAQRKNAGPTFRKMMGNYFSFGPESRIGYEFDKKRTKSRFANKLVYAWSGAKRLGRKVVRLNDVVEKCYEGDRVLFSTEASGDSGPRLVGNPTSLVILNINSMAGGLDLWPIAHKSGLQGVDTGAFTDQMTGDGRLEVLSYQSFGAFVTEQLRNRATSGNGHRIVQTEGPLRIVFRPKHNRKLYMQIDGEYYAVEGVTEIQVQHSVTVKALFRKK
jgi:diacylglycerol kinase (ATP)